MQEPTNPTEIESLIERMFVSVWCATLGGALRAPGRADHWPSRGEVLSARICIRGDTPLDVSLHCPRETAREFAAAFYRAPVSTIDDGQVESTLLELVNILGGNLKGALPGRNQISLPKGVFAEVCPLGTPPCIGHELSFRGWNCRLSIQRPASKGD